VSGIEEASVRALAKLEQLLPSRLRRRVRTLGEATSAFSFQTERVDADLLADVAAACRDTMQVRFSYLTRDERSGERHAEPTAVVYSGSRWYLLAWDLERDDWRTFRVDRIRGRLRPAGRGRARAVPGGDPAAYVRSRLQSAGERIAGDDTPPGRVRIQAPAGKLRGRVPSRWATVEPDSDDTSVITTRGPWRQEFLVWMASLGEPFQVLDPPELADAARGLAQRLAEATPT
jgi:predicted DNA-binding transcriptional regulator YafY